MLKIERVDAFLPSPPYHRVCKVELPTFCAPRRGLFAITLRRSTLSEKADFSACCLFFVSFCTRYPQPLRLVFARSLCRLFVALTIFPMSALRSEPFASIRGSLPYYACTTDEFLACSFLPLIVDRDRSDVCCRRCRIALRLAIIPPYLPSPTFAPHRIRKAPSLPFTQRLCNAQRSYKEVELAAQARERFCVRPEHKCPKARALRRQIFSARLLRRPKPCFAASRRLILPPLFPHSPHLCSTRTTRRPSGIEAPV